jgi:hypothetical protein
MKAILTAGKRKSLLVFISFLFIAVITALYGQQLAARQNNIRVWDWMNVVLLLIGLPFILLQKEAGLPEVSEPSVSNKKRILHPFLIGLFFGALDVLIVKFILHPQPYDSLPPFLQPFPYSVFLFTSGALEIEIFYRLIPITFILFLGNWLFKNKYGTILFWVAAVLTALREPLEQWPDGAVWFVVYAATSGFLMNFLQAVYFRKAGFLASLTIRLGHYFLWHILLGIYVEYVELAK